MKRYLGYGILLLIFILFALILVGLLGAETRQASRPSSTIGVVVYGDENSDRWRYLSQGIGQACGELGLEVPVLIQVDGDDIGGQLRQLQREVQSGVDGLLIAAGDSAALEGFLSGLAPGVKVVAVETGMGDGVPRISADDRQMGRELADSVPLGEGTVGVLRENIQRDSVRLRFEGFAERMGEQGREFVVLEREEEDDLLSFIASRLAVYRPSLDILVLLDNESLETAIDALPASMVEAHLYGIGSSSKVVHALDQGMVQSIVFQNEYAIGYLGVMTLAGEMGIARGPAQVGVQYRVVNREIMYDPENERLLFPIVQ